MSGSFTHCRFHKSSLKGETTNVKLISLGDNHKPREADPSPRSRNKFKGASLDLTRGIKCIVTGNQNSSCSVQLELRAYVVLLFQPGAPDVLYNPDGALTTTSILCDETLWLKAS